MEFIDQNVVHAKDEERSAQTTGKNEALLVEAATPCVCVCVVTDSPVEGCSGPLFPPAVAPCDIVAVHPMSRLPPARIGARVGSGGSLGTPRFVARPCARVLRPCSPGVAGQHLVLCKVVLVVLRCLLCVVY